MKILIKGAGDLASGIAYRLKCVGHEILMTDIDVPTAVRREVAFSRCIYEGTAIIEGVRAVCMTGRDIKEIEKTISDGYIAVVADGNCKIKDEFKPEVIIDAILAKKNLGTKITDAPLVVGVGPGFTAGEDCHAVVETMRGHTLGRVIRRGTAIPNTGVPGNIGGFTSERLIRAAADGIFEPVVSIGDEVNEGDIVAYVVSGKNREPVTAQIHGIVRGLLQRGVHVHKGMKSGDVDPRAKREYCFQISDKALSIAGGVLEAVTEYERSGKQKKKSEKNIALVLLAAGAGQRFGSNKLLERINGKPMAFNGMELKAFTSFSEKYVVTGYDEIAAKAESLGYTVIINDRPEDGISRSLKLGLKNALLKDPELDAVMFSVCDQPYITNETVDGLKKAYMMSEKGIAGINCDGGPGNPNIIGKKYFAELFCLEGDTGGKRVIRRHTDDIILIDAQNGKELRDIDKREDMQDRGAEDDPLTKDIDTFS